MNILFVWTGVTSYMADCWRELSRRDGVSLEVVVEQVASGRAFDAAKVLSGFNCRVVEDGRLPAGIARPDILFAVGWHSQVVREAVGRKDWADVPKVCCFDMPWRWSLRCFAARFLLWPFLRRYSAAYVPGRVAAHYARWLGFSRVEEGLFSIGMDRFVNAPKPQERKGFLFVGRYSPEKRVDLVERAHARYRELGGKWSLDCYGQGGRFAAPDEMPSIYASHACLLLASAFDPWPLVALEARSAGCEVVMSDRCGNRFELPGARVVKYGDIEAMAREMMAVERGAGFLVPDASLRRYDCTEWATRTLRFMV